MRTETITTEIFKFNELSDEAKEKALEICRDYNVNGDFWHDYLEEFIIEEYEDIARELYKALEKEYEYLTSDEAIKETIEANGYEFTEDGNQY